MSIDTMDSFEVFVVNLIGVLNYHFGFSYVHDDELATQRATRTAQKEKTVYRNSIKPVKWNRMLAQGPRANDGKYYVYNFITNGIS